MVNRRVGIVVPVAPSTLAGSEQLRTELLYAESKRPGTTEAGCFRSA